MLSDNNFYLPDTIVAQATPVGCGAIGVIRLSGAQAPLFLSQIFQAKINPNSFQSHQMYHGTLIDPSTSHKIDDVLVVWMKAPHSYTGEEIVEIHAHGGSYLLCRIISVLLHLGARLAEPGEFTKRAYLNGRMDLTKAEAVADLIHAQSDWMAQNALDQLDGYLAQIIHRIKREILDLLARLEVGFDFIEEDVQLFDKTQGVGILQNLQNQISQLIDSFQTGKILRDGLRIALIGKPNVGKSSLLNALLKEDRAIIHEEAGTTRDVIEGQRRIGGVMATLYDTAGIREGVHSVEKEGIKRSKMVLEKADLICLLYDVSQIIEDQDKILYDIIKNKPHLLLGTKSDLRPLWQWNDLDFCAASPHLPISIRDEKSLTNLLSRIEDITIKKELNKGHNYVLNNVRHYVQIKLSSEKINEIIKGLKEDQINEECLVEELKQVVNYLCEITGEIHSEQVLDEIFSRFCIGK